jgi:DNA mismatch endonuclease, patch repair protein
MQRQPRRDTSCELALRRALHRRGLRFRVEATLPELGRRRRVDVVFPGRRVAVLVDGCFWHGCPTHGTWPAANAGWWAEKIARNQWRDADTTAVLAAAGWTVLRFWEHEDVTAAANAVERAVRAAPSPGRPEQGDHPDGG